MTSFENRDLTTLELISLKYCVLFKNKQTKNVCPLPFCLSLPRDPLRCTEVILVVYYSNPRLPGFANSNLTAPREQLLSETQPTLSQACGVVASISFHFCPICRCQKLAPYLTYKGMWACCCSSQCTCMMILKPSPRSRLSSCHRVHGSLIDQGSTSVELDKCLKHLVFCL